MVVSNWVIVVPKVVIVVSKLVIVVHKVVIVVSKIGIVVSKIGIVVRKWVIVVSKSVMVVLTLIKKKKIRVWCFFLVKASLCRVYSCSDRPFFKVIVALVVFWGTMAVRNGVVVVHETAYCWFLHGH